jgi:AmmeMemoRadiSam system protein B
MEAKADMARSILRAMPTPSPNEDRPRLRPLEGYTVDVGGQKMLALRDPSGVSPNVAQLPPLAAAVLQLCDGHATRDQICEEFFNRYQRKLTREALDQLLGQLDKALLLDSEAFRHHSAQLFAEFSRSPERAPFHAGKSYPEEGAELNSFLNRCYDPPHGPGQPKRGSGDLPKAIIAPHIDFHRGGPAYAWAYKALAEARELPELIVVFATDHNGAEHPFTLTKKNYQTPLGPLTTDQSLVDLLFRTAGGEMLFADEHHHRGEHALEFQAVWLRHSLGENASKVPILPVLCGTMHRFIEDGSNPSEAADVGGFIHNLVTATAGKRVLWVAGADLAHVGPRFGDETPLDEADRQSLEKRDQVTLRHVAQGDPAGWFEEIRREQDRRRVCGLTPIYALLAAAKPGRGQLTAYGQCPAEEGSIVSIASIVY